MPAKEIAWTDLGAPTTPGVYRVARVGAVRVEQEDIDTARELGGNPLLELHDATGFGSSVRHFVIGLFTPQESSQTNEAQSASEMGMNPRILKLLIGLAKTRGSTFHRPQNGGEEDLRDFQDEVDDLYALQELGILKVIGTPHKESKTGRDYVDLIKVELTRQGAQTLSKPEDIALLGDKLKVDSKNMAMNEADKKTVFVVHGRNMALRDSLFSFLRALGLRPLEWSQAVRETGKASPYIGEVLDSAFSIAQAVVVLMTPDDEAVLLEQFRGPDEPTYETQPTPQARPNVLFEAGMAMGRSPDRTILVEVGKLRPFSDIGGRHVVKLDNSSKRRHDLVDRLEVAGCVVDITGRDWHTTGDFSPPTIAPSSLLVPASKAEETLPVAQALELIVDHKMVRGFDQAEEYELTLWLNNKSQTRVDDFIVEMEFPAPFIQVSIYIEVADRNTSTHRFFRATQDTHGGPIHAGDRRRVMVIPYTVNYFEMSDLRTSGLLREFVKITVRVGDMGPLQRQIEMTDLVNL